MRTTISEQVLAEAAGGDHRLQILVRRADDAGVDGDRLAAADALDDPFLEEAQELDLKGERDVADLVEEQGAALGELDLALRRLDRAGEGALFVAEQLGLEQILRDGGAVDRDEGPAGAAAGGVDAAGEQLLAGTAGAEQHHRHAGIGDPFDRPRDLEHLRRGGDHGAEDGAVVPGFLLEPAVLVLDPVELEGAPNDEAELIDVDRLLVEIVGARRDRPQRAFARAVAGRDDDLRVRLERQDRLQRREALAHPVRIGRQAEVERHHRRLLGAQDVEGAFPVRRDEHFVIVIGPAQLALQTLVVLDDEQARLEGSVHACIRS
jgi:hypothetical protein